MKKTSRPCTTSLLAATLLLGLTACEGLFDGIYDEQVADDEEEVQGETIDDGTTTVGEGYGFISTDGNTGTIYINATDYYTWTLIDFSAQRASTITIDSETFEDPFTDEMSWDIAIHRWDVRTNGGSALETSYTALSQVTSIPTGTYVADVWTTDVIAVDMTNMMTGDIGYSAGYVNTELSKWMDVDTNNPPPVYTPSGKVYSIKLADGTYALIILSDYIKQGGTTKGYLTIDYIYPFE